MLTMNTPRLPAPFFVLMVIVLNPLPVILCSERPTFKLFPFPACEALMMRVPLAFVIVNITDPDSLEVSLWLNDRLLGLSVETHCGFGGLLGVGVAVG